MQFVNDDMDEMFRRAAENYPLDTRSADWNKIAAALGDGKSKPEEQDRKKFLWLLLLLPLGLVCNYYYQKAGTNPGHNAIGVNNPQHTDQSSTVNVDNTDNKTFSGTAKQSTEQSKELNHTSTNSLISSKLSDQKSAAFKGKTRKGKTGIGVSGTNIQASAIEESGRTGLDNERTITYTNFLPQNNRFFKLSAEPVIAGTKTIVNPASPAIIKLSRPKRFYVGITGGIDATTIKFQKITNAGYTLGAIAGYKFRPRWSVEAGILTDKKFYYTDGKYFNTSKIYIPPNSKITEVDGNCRMVELPLTVRHSFKTHSRTTGFAAIGLSSYLIMKEQYNYLYYYGNSGTSVVHYKSYDNSSQDWFSVLQVSGGFSRTLGKFANLRVEPYIKMPMRGTGFGKLPLLSGGLNFALTKDLF